MLEQFIELAGAGVTIRMAGDGEPLLVLHGMADGGQWLPFHDQLAARRTVIAPDHPGFGTSARPAWLMSMADMLRGYLELLDKLGLHEVEVVGSCFGGWLAAELAVLRPELFRRMCLIAPLGIKGKGVPIEDVFMLSLQGLPAFLYHDKGLVEQAVGDAQKPEVIGRQMSDRKTLALLAWNPYLHNPGLARWLHRIKCPVQLIWGAEDRVIPAATAEAWGLAAHIIPDCGHLPHVEKPETVEGLI